MRQWIALGALAALFGCGSAPSATPCQTSCDCQQTTADSRCPGEWVCNAEKVCAWACKGTCQEGAPYTCRDGEECNGSICSEKTGCPR